MKQSIFCLFLALLIACGQATDPYAAYLRVVTREEAAWLDPRKGVSMTASPLHFLLFEGLMKVDENGELVPGIATRYTISPDKKTYTFHLAKHARWSNGEPLFASAFEKSWKTMLSPSFISKDAYLLYPIKNAKKAHLEGGSLDKVGIYARGPHTLVVELEYPHEAFLELVALSAFVPVYPDIDKKNPNWAKDASADFIGNGPFTLTDWIHGSELVFKKNEHYYKANEVSLPGIWIRIIPSEMSYLRMYRQGDVDYIGSPLSPVPISAYPSLLAENKLKSVSVVGTKVLSFNVENSLLKNRHVRRALNFAIDRESIVQNLTCLNEEIATRALPQILTTHPQKDLFPDRAMDLARKELAKANLTQKQLETPIIITYWGSHLNDLISQHIQHIWEKELGLKVRLEKVTLKNILAKIQSRSYEVCLCAFISEIKHPINILERFVSKENLRNYPGWECPEYIQTYQKDRFNISRDEGFENLEKILMEEFPYAPLYHYKFAYLKSDRLEDDVRISYLGHPLFAKMRFKKTTK